MKKATTKTLPDAVTTRGGVKAVVASKIQGILNKLIFGKQRKCEVNTKSGPNRLRECIHEHVEEKVTLEYGSVVKDCGVREWFCHDIEMSLSYIETAMLYDLSQEYMFG